ncbi:hypothetical protein ACFLUG_04805 [Chloroflexota bacterium]
MESSHIRVTVLGGDASGECDADCGMDWNSAESISLASGLIKERFGSQIQIEYLDISGDLADPAAAEWREMVTANGLSLPVLLLNNRVRISGRFDIRQLLDAVEIEMEVGINNG